ncbi:hypothetical protein LCGC14_2729590 [marine sediment metagenome]|uniref:Uncharacterized protein n=1 Tax=marine sediment metagenome TaxID=412755 RepID=A0A0F8Z7N7_9ZZZZ
MTDITLNVEIYCSCGEGLCNQTDGTSTRHRSAPCFVVEPCTKCLEREYDRGYSKAEDDSGQR